MALDIYRTVMIKYKATLKKPLQLGSVPRVPAERCL